ncbi:ATP-binding cassette, subfamily B [Clostridium collagenovorans DSM 3089]|uniref:ATP-binding cassette, subfamily B n=1 Tax=Clostridium collagenovorans DSM 3089 TaxID=1121306 RepID=A0A1M5VZS0_9CLOT|nr:ABC transporter ATP-binding protein [Clostridium collagenovorans]SHH80707.1 ATP-binding cassette, subfamily B [Clostridium collagenovorans DSM 3089]
MLQGEKYSWVDMINIPFKCAPINTIVIAIIKLLDGLIPTLQVIATAKFLDNAIAVVNGTKVIGDVFIPILMLITLVAYSWVSRQICKFVEVKLELKLKETFRVSITEKRARLKFKHIENNDTWNLISRVAKEPEKQCKDAYMNLLSFMALILKCLGLLMLLMTQVWWSTVLIIAVSIPLIMLAIKGGKANYEANRVASKYKRRYEYIGEVLRGREAVDERTLFGYTEELNKKWVDEYECARKIELKTNLKWFVKMKTGGVLVALISSLIALILIGPVKKGVLSIGMFISIINAVFDLIQIMTWQLTYYTDQLAKNKEYLKDLSEVSRLEESNGALDEPSKENLKLKTLEFKNVSFKYPGTENYILNNMSFKIEEGRHYAFVGINGAGKTTITKLITGLYEDFEGEILINNISIREYSQSVLKSLCSVVYQDFAKYFISIKENIALGDINNMNNKEQEEVINKSIEIIDLKEEIEKLPKGIDTTLGKIKEDGQDISGGQWQRIAMARSIISPATLRILDEPTAALDPISESNLYEKFEEISRGNTTIFISHRLGSTKLANEIFVIGSGEIVEKGSHEELMNNNGIYAEMYESQRSWYL